MTAVVAIEEGFWSRALRGRFLYGNDDAGGQSGVVDPNGNPTATATAITPAGAVALLGGAAAGGVGAASGYIGVIVIEECF